jgi:hypothetical protein
MNHTRAALLTKLSANLSCSVVNLLFAADSRSSQRAKKKTLLVLRKRYGETAGEDHEEA